MKSLSTTENKQRAKKQERLTLEQFRALAEKIKPANGKKNKYHAQKYNGYASKKEYYRSEQLKLWLKAGLISDLREQVTYTLIPSQINSEGITERAVKYKADFVYIDNETGKTVVEDTKGVRTPEYIIKRKLMLRVHDITIKEI